MNDKNNDENENRLNSIDIIIKERNSNENEIYGNAFSNLDYDEEEISHLIERKLSFYVKKKNSSIILLIIFIVLLIIALVCVIVIFITKSESRPKDKSKVCPSRCVCNGDFQCIKCKENNYLFLKHDKICLLKNYSFVAIYNYDITTIKLINDSYRDNITKMRIERIDDESINSIEFDNNITTNYSSCQKGNISVYFNMDLKGSSSTDKMFYNVNKMTLIYFFNLDTKDIKDMNSMFQDCNSLTSININAFNTTNVLNMDTMFSNCYSQQFHLTGSHHYPIYQEKKKTTHHFSHIIITIPGKPTYHI